MSEEETGSATCTAEGQTTVTTMVVLGESIYTDQMSKSIPKTAHELGGWLFGDVEHHSGVCATCGETKTLPHEWEGHACSTCGQKDAYFVVGGGTVTVFAAKIEKIRVF